MPVRTHARHIRQAQVQHKALRHETVAQIRAFHASAVARVKKPISDLVAAYASARSNNAGDDSEDDSEPRHVPRTWLLHNRQLEHTKNAARLSVRQFAGDALAITVRAKSSAAYQATRAAEEAVLRAVARVSEEKRPPLHRVQPAPSDDTHTAIYTAANGADASTLFDGMDEECALEIQRATTTAAATDRDEAWLEAAILAALMRSLYRAQTVARDQALDCWRVVTLNIYVANRDVLQGWVWIALLGSCCVACALMHGTVHDISEGMDSHVCCACTAMPLAIGDDSGGDIQSGADWLNEQDDSVLQDKLGPAAFNAWKAGDVELGDFIATKHDSQWGDSIYQPSLRQLGLDASDYTA